MTKRPRTSQHWPFDDSPLPNYRADRHASCRHLSSCDRVCVMPRPASGPRVCAALVGRAIACWHLPARPHTPRTDDSRRPHPAAPAVYMGRQIAQTMHFSGAEWLIRDVREREERCSLMLANLGVQARHDRLRHGMRQRLLQSAAWPSGRPDGPRPGGRHSTRNAGHAARTGRSSRRSRTSRRFSAPCTTRGCPRTAST